jgi:hypothetical protein
MYTGRPGNEGKTFPGRPGYFYDLLTVVSNFLISSSESVLIISATSSDVKPLTSIFMAISLEVFLVALLVAKFYFSRGIREYCCNGDYGF